MDTMDKQVDYTQDKLRLTFDNGAVVEVPEHQFENDSFHLVLVLASRVKWESKESI